LRIRLHSLVIVSATELLLTESCGLPLSRLHVPCPEVSALVCYSEPSPCSRRVQDERARAVLFRGLPPPQSAFRLVVGCSLLAFISRDTRQLSPAAAPRAFDFEVLFLAEMRVLRTVLPARGPLPSSGFFPLWVTHPPVPRPSRRSPKHPLMVFWLSSRLSEKSLGVSRPPSACC